MSGDAWRVASEDGRTVKAGKRVICRAWADQQMNADQDALRHARLIAAAPEMLEALNAFPAEADFSNAENFRTAAIAWFEMIARAAISKAEGQS